MTPDEAVAALRARFDPSTGRFPGASPTAALLFLLDQARSGGDERSAIHSRAVRGGLGGAPLAPPSLVDDARRLALSALRRTPGDALPSVHAAVAEAAVHVEAAHVARDEGLEKTARAAVDAALRAFGWSSASQQGDERSAIHSRAARGGPGGAPLAPPGSMDEGTDAHGLMIATLARAAIVLDAPGYREAASSAGEQALDRRVDASLGTLLHLTGEGQRPAGIGDYALLIRGLLELLEASGEKGWLHEAVRLQGEQEERLWDAREGGYFELPEGAERRGKNGSDDSLLSGNGVAALNLIDISRLTGQASYRERAERLLKAFASDVAKDPLAHLTLLRAAQRLDRTSSPA